MAMHTAHQAHYSTVRPGMEAGRLVLTLIGGAALIVGALLDWTRDTAGAGITNRSLLQIDFAARSDIVKTVGGLVIALGVVAVIGLLDRSGWLTRLAGALGIVLFVLFAVEVYRSSEHTLQAGSWLTLAGGIVLVLGGLLAPHMPAEEVPVVLEENERRDDDAL